MADQSHALKWWREKGALRVYVTPFGFYEIKRNDKKTFRVYLNREGTQHFGTEDECMRTVQRVVNSMLEQRNAPPPVVTKKKEVKRAKRT